MLFRAPEHIAVKGPDWLTTRNSTWLYIYARLRAAATFVLRVDGNERSVQLRGTRSARGDLSGNADGWVRARPGTRIECGSAGFERMEPFDCYCNGKMMRPGVRMIGCGVPNAANALSLRMGSCQSH